MKLATTTGDFGAYTNQQEDSARYCRAAGFRYLDYNFGMDYRHRNGIYGENPAAYLEKMKRHSEEIGVSFVQSHAPMGAPLAPNNEQFVQDTIQCIHACGALGIPNLVVHSGYLPGLTPQETFRRNREFYLPLLQVAEQYGVNILVENFNKMCVDGLYWIDNATDLLAMIECVDHPLFHAVWDAGHANMQEMPQDEELRLLGKHVYALHVQDNYGDSDAHIAPFFGSLSLDSLMHGLQDIGYKGYFTFESNFFRSANGRRVYEPDTRLAQPPLALYQKAETLLYEIGKSILTAYDCLEE